MDNCLVTASRDALSWRTSYCTDSDSSECEETSRWSDRICPSDDRMVLRRWSTSANTFCWSPRVLKPHSVNLMTLATVFVTSTEYKMHLLRSLEKSAHNLEWPSIPPEGGISHKPHYATSVQVSVVTNGDARWHRWGTNNLRIQLERRKQVIDSTFQASKRSSGPRPDKEAGRIQSIRPNVHFPLSSMTEYLFQLGIVHVRRQRRINANGALLQKKITPLLLACNMSKKHCRIRSATDDEWCQPYWATRQQTLDQIGISTPPRPWPTRA